MEEMRYISLDLSLNHAGYAIWEDSILVHGQYWNLDKNLSFGDKLAKIEEYIEYLCELVAPNCLVLEKCAFGAKGNLTKLGAAAGIAHLVAATAGIPIYEVANNSWKKDFTGKGNASKEETLDKAIEMFPLLTAYLYADPAGKYEVADAIGLGCAWFRKQGGQLNEEE